MRPLQLISDFSVKQIGARPVVRGGVRSGSYFGEARPVVLGGVRPGGGVRSGAYFVGARPVFLGEARPVVRGVPPVLRPRSR